MSLKGTGLLSFKVGSSCCLIKWVDRLVDTGRIDKTVDKMWMPMNWAVYTGAGLSMTEKFR